MIFEVGFSIHLNCIGVLEVTVCDAKHEVF